MSKFVGKFPKETDQTEEYMFKTNTYDRKQRDKKKDMTKQSKYFDSYESNLNSNSKRQKNQY